MVAMHQAPPAPHQSFVSTESAGPSSATGSAASVNGRRASDGDVSSASSQAKQRHGGHAQQDRARDNREAHRQTSNSTARAIAVAADLPDMQGLTLEQAARHAEARHATYPQLSRSRQGHAEAAGKPGRLTYPYDPNSHGHASDMERADTLQQPKPLLPNSGVSQMPLPAELLPTPATSEDSRPAGGPGLVPYPQYHHYDSNVAAMYAGGSAYTATDSARASASSISPVSGQAYNAQAAHYNMQGQGMMPYGANPAMGYPSQMYGHPAATSSDQYGSSTESPSPNSYEYDQRYSAQGQAAYGGTPSVQGHFVYVNPEAQSYYNPTMAPSSSGAYSGPSSPISSPPMGAHGDMALFGNGSGSAFYDPRTNGYWQHDSSAMRGGHGGMPNYMASRGRGRGGPDRNALYGSMHAAMGSMDYGAPYSNGGYPAEYSPGPQATMQFGSSGRHSAYSGSSHSNQWHSPNMGYPPEYSTPRSSLGGSYIGSPLQHQTEWVYGPGRQQQYPQDTSRGRAYGSRGGRGRQSVGGSRRDNAGGWYAQDQSYGQPSGLRYSDVGLSPRQVTKDLGSVGLGIRPGAGGPAEEPQSSHAHARPVQRKEYHPQAPANRSDWVMWVGNVPGNVTHEEMWQFFTGPLNLDELPSDTRPESPYLGIASIFLISRSSCGFVNLKSAQDLHVAIAYFNGRSLRPWDAQCPKLVCRIRKTEDDLKAGVGAQRGSGMHSRYIRDLKVQQAQQPLKVDVDLAKQGRGHASHPSGGSIPSPAVGQGPPSAPGGGISPAAFAAWHHDRSVSGSHSFASTNSSFLQRNFPKRFFILKSSTQEELEHSLETGTWRTQAHNEPILDQAFRTSPEVFLIFGANRQGCFFGYALMRSAIRAPPARERHSVSWSSKVGDSSGSSGTRSSGTRSSISKSAVSPGSLPERIAEEQDDAAPGGQDPTAQTGEPATESGSKSSRPKFLHTPSSTSDWRLASSSPREMSPGDELKYPRLSPVSPAMHERNTEPGRIRDAEITPVDDRHRTNTLDPKLLSQQERHRMFVSAPGGEDFELDEDAPKRAKRANSDPPKEEPVAVTDADGITRKDMVTSGDNSPLDAVPEGEPLDAAGPLPQTGPVEDASGPASLGGTSFKIEWIKVGQLPFTRLKHLRNPWNQDKEIKVSRDGTELEPRVAAQLLEEWEHLPGAQVAPKPTQQE